MTPAFRGCWLYKAVCPNSLTFKGNKPEQQAISREPLRQTHAFESYLFLGCQIWRHRTSGFPIMVSLQPKKRCPQKGKHTRTPPRLSGKPLRIAAWHGVEAGSGPGCPAPGLAGAPLEGRREDSGDAQPDAQPPNSFCKRESLDEVGIVTWGKCRFDALVAS